MKTDERYEGKEPAEIFSKRVHDFFSFPWKPQPNQELSAKEFPVQASGLTLLCADQKQKWERTESIRPEFSAHENMPTTEPCRRAIARPTAQR